jgi:EAL domain-containing protein (putative c-di-GMP-specific phosphodiesterase class I)
MPALGEHLGNAGVAVNISAAHLTAPHLADDIRQTLRKSGVDPGRIKIEITETAMMSNAEVAQDAVAALHGGGVRIVLDDFGTGHSSLAYLHRLPIVGLKIDRSFIEPLARDRDALAIVRSIVGLAQNLDLYTVAEGVETAEQLAIVKELGIPFAQGFYFSAALPLADLLRYVGAPVVS